MKMTDFTKMLAEKQETTASKADKNFREVLSCLFEDALTEDGESLRTEYGTFKVVKTAAREAREGVNPRDPEGPKIQIPAIPAQKKIVFKMSKSFKDNFNS